MSNPYARSRRAQDNRREKAAIVAAFIADTRIDRAQLFAQPDEEANAELERERRRREVEKAAGVRACSLATWTVIKVMLDRGQP